MSKATDTSSEAKPTSKPEKPAKKTSAKNIGAAAVEGVWQAIRPVVATIEAIGGHAILAGRAVSWIPRPPYRIRNYMEALEYIGFGSLPIVLLVGLFTGMVTTLQSVYAFRTFGLESIAGGTTGQAVAVELGPVLTALMLAGRAGAGIATEIGTMRISEQIDALESMAINPVQFLVMPRVVSGFLTGPVLTLLFFVVAMVGSYLVAVINLGVDYGQFMKNFKDFVYPVHVVQGLIKAAIFGFTVTLVGCYQGYNASGGGRGVGIGTTRAVVIGSVAVLVLDYFATEVLLAVLPPPK